MYIGLVFVVLFASFAMLFRQGVWTGALTLINLITAALLATNFWEPLADWFDQSLPTFTYYWDFIAIWAIFAVCFSLFRAATDFLSKTQVKFLSIVDSIGGALLALWIGWVLVCFATMTLHMAPLARTPMFGSFQPTPEARMFMGLAPDRQWLGFVQSVSLGAFCTSPPEGVEPEDGCHPFDPNGEFIFKYAQRRANFEQQPENRVERKK